MLLLLVLLSVLRPSTASLPTSRAGELPSHEQYDCRPFGECEPCPKSQVRLELCSARLQPCEVLTLDPVGRPFAQRHEPFCQPYGNRRLLHCVPKGHAHHDITPIEEGGENLHEKEIPAWEACGKVVLKERQDYWEFVVRPWPRVRVLFSRPSAAPADIPPSPLADGKYALLYRWRDRHASARTQVGDAPVPAAGRANRPAWRRR